MRNKLRKILCSVLAFCQIFVMTAYAKPDWPNDTGIQAEAGAVMDVDSGTLIFGQNSHVEYPPASITKLLTALIVLENADLSDTVTFSDVAMNSVEADSGNKLSLVAGDTMTVEDCLYALLLVSVNQAANALAEHVAGSIPAFVEMMNQRLVGLGCNDSHFENPSGLNGDTQNVSAYDMAKIACAAFGNEKLLKISSTVSRKLGPTSMNPDGITVRQEHRLVITEDTTSPFYCPDAVAGKTGYLLKAGNTLVTYGERDGRRVVSVILKGSPRQYFVDGKALLEFGLSSFYNADIAENETRYVSGTDPVDINGTSYSPEDLRIEEGKVITLPKNAVFSEAELSLSALPEDHPANAAALLVYTYNDRKIGQAYLLDKTIEPAVSADASVNTADADGADSNTAEAASDGKESDEKGAGGVDNAGNGEAAKDNGNGQTTGDADGKNGGVSLPVLLILLGILVLAALAALVYRIKQNRKKEAEEAAARRERRKQRLMEEGAGAEEEFNRLLDEMRKKHSEKDR